MCSAPKPPPAAKAKDEKLRILLSRDKYEADGYTSGTAPANPLDQLKRGQRTAGSDGGRSSVGLKAVA